MKAKSLIRTFGRLHCFSVELSVGILIGIIFGASPSNARAQCAADINGDHAVTALDLAGLLAAWGPTSTPHPADLNQDQFVDAQDLTILLAGWGSCPGPIWATVLEWNPDSAVVTDAAFRTRMLATGLPWRVTDNATGIEMLLVPPSVFMMGVTSGDSEASSWEGPAHQVTLTHAFYLGRSEVTQATWFAEMGTNPSAFQSSTNNPVEQISWTLIQTFCTQNNARLPTEAEWECACRGGNLAPRYGVIGDIAWWGCSSTGGNSGCTTHQFANRLPNSLGFYDMLGNVWDWVSDWYGNYSAASVTDPTGPATGTTHVLRGGSWNSSAATCRASSRNYSTNGNSASGFRMAKNP